MDRPAKRAHIPVPPAPKPTWSDSWEIDIDGELAHVWRGKLDREAMQDWVNWVEDSVARGIFTQEQVTEYEREWLEQEHMERWDNDPGPANFRERWMSRTFETAPMRAPEQLESGDTLSRRRNRVFHPGLGADPARAKYYETREFRAPEYVRPDTDYSRRERERVGGIKREYNPEQRNMHIYYPRGPNPFRELRIPTVTGIHNEEVNINAAVRSIDRHDRTLL